MDEIPVSTRDTHEQLAFHDQRSNVVDNVYNNQSSVKVSISVGPKAEVPRP